MSPDKMILLAVRNLKRSKTRSFATITGCGIAAFIVCFFVSAEHSMDQLLYDKSADTILIVKQQDRF